MNDDLRVNRSILLVLGALLEKSGESAIYGLDLMRQTRLSSGSLYPALARLEHAGWIESSWHTPEPERYPHVTLEAAK